MLVVNPLKQSLTSRTKGCLLFIKPMRVVLCFQDCLLFIKPMREAEYVTMLDPFQVKYGPRVGALLFLPALLGDLFWVGAILNALGSSLTVILEINITTSVIVSTIFAASYTMVGGLYSVSYTDVLQLVCIVLGLVISVPFAYYHPAVKHDSLETVDWVGTLAPEDVGIWLDTLLLLIFGGIPWQVDITLVTPLTGFGTTLAGRCLFQSYFQRVLSIRSTRIAQMLSVVAMVGCMAMAVPAAFTGIIARGTDWEKVDGFNTNITTNEGEIVLPLVLRFLTPSWVSFFGLGAISAAVMSSADASILGSSAMFTRNVYKLAFRPNASEREGIWVLRAALVTVSTLAACVALFIGSIYYLSYLCSDLVYVILFPQLLLVVHWPNGVNKYGSGELGLGIPVVIEFPFYDEVANIQRFPFKTFSMLCALVSHLLASTITRIIFEQNWLSADRWDVLDAFPHLKTGFDSTNEKYRETPLDGMVGRQDSAVLPIVAMDENNRVFKNGLVNPLLIDGSKDSKF
uniref:High-affinity choline transporter 1 n=1 Tax=Timema douglasi TaxID=61478 RepID=A0A7R8Z8U2_TIMDO|nr:unnamed protein product [Timema douglasi]